MYWRVATETAALKTSTLLAASGSWLDQEASSAQSPPGPVQMAVGLHGFTGSNLRQKLRRNENTARHTSGQRKLSFGAVCNCHCHVTVRNVCLCCAIVFLARRAAQTSRPYRTRYVCAQDRPAREETGKTSDAQPQPKDRCFNRHRHLWTFFQQHWCVVGSTIVGTHCGNACELYLFV